MAAGIQFSPDDLDLAARVIVAENQTSPSPKEQAAIAAVMRNRVLSGDPGFGGNSLKNILTARTAKGGFQFTPLGLPVVDDEGKRTNNPRNVDANDPAYQSAYTIARNTFSGTSKDPTNGAVYYYAPKTQAKLGQPDPPFAQGRKGVPIGQHSFYGPMPKRNADDVDDPDAFLQQHMQENQKAGLTSKSSSPTADPDAVDDPDAFLSEHISGKQPPNQSAAINGGGVPGQTNQRVQQAFEAMDKQPDMVSRMFPIQSMTDVPGMARRYGYYAATDPLGTGIKTAAGLGALATAPTWLPELAAPAAAVAGRVLASPWTKLAGFEEIVNHFQGVRSLYDLVNKAGSAP